MTSTIAPNQAGLLHSCPFEIRQMIFRFLLVASPAYSIQLAPDWPSGDESIFDTIIEYFDPSLDSERKIEVAKQLPPKRAHRICPLLPGPGVKDDSHVDSTSHHGSSFPGCCDCPSQYHYSCISAGILRTCKQFYDEGIQMLYADNIFMFEDMADFHYSFLVRIGLRNAEKIRSVQFSATTGSAPLIPRDRGAAPTGMGMEGISMETWWALSNLRNVEWLFRWENVRKWSQAVPIGYARREEWFNEWNSTNSHVRVLETICAEIEAEAGMLVRMLEMQRRRYWIDKRWIRLRISNGVDAHGSEAGDGDEEAEAMTNILKDLEWYGPVRPPEPVSMEDAISSIIRSHWAKVRRQIAAQATTEFEEKRLLASRLTRKSAHYLHDPVRLNGVFVISLEPIWLEGGE